VLDLERLVEAKVADALAHANGRLEQLVAHAVDRELERLVRQLVEQNLNGRDGEPQAHDPVHENTKQVAPPQAATAPAALTTKRCTHCGETKPVGEFPAGRRVCRACRNTAIRRKRAAARERASAPLAAPGTGSNSPSFDDAGIASPPTASAI
jgi:hypothetical protein